VIIVEASSSTSKKPKIELFKRGYIMSKKATWKSRFENRIYGPKRTCDGCNDGSDEELVDYARAVYGAEDINGLPVKGAPRIDIRTDKIVAPGRKYEYDYDQYGLYDNKKEGDVVTYENSDYYNQSKDTIGNYLYKDGFYEIDCLGLVKNTLEDRAYDYDEIWECVLYEKTRGKKPSVTFH
jgi:hypothetical protein